MADTEQKIENKGPAHIEMISGPEEGKVFPVADGETVMGRGPDGVQIALDDSSVSRTHVSITMGADRVFIRDLGSLNGTKLNGLGLRPDEDAPLHDGDQFQLGIYLFKFVSSAPNAEKKTAPAAPELGQEPDRQAAPEPAPAPQEKSAWASIPEAGVTDKSDVVREAALAPVRPPSFAGEPEGLKLIRVFIILGVISVLGGLASYGYFRKHRPTPEPVPVPAATKPPTEAPPEPPPVESGPPRLETGTSMNVVSMESHDVPEKAALDVAARGFSAFLDVTTKPTTARILLGDKLLGMSPLKAPVFLMPGKKYELIAEFDLIDIRDRYQMRIPFTADVRHEVISIPVEAEIATVKILKLPRHVDFYLEGYYAYDRERAHPVRLTDIIYGKPIFVPYGHYVIELREKVKVGEGANYLSQTRYHREFDLNRDKPALELSIQDRDLLFFPARIQTDPPGAALYYGKEKMGFTPYTGDLPLGRHEMKLVLDGYFDHVEDLGVQTNTLYERTIVLTTSEVGSLLNKAREQGRQGNHHGAIELLVDALKLKGTERENARAHYLLGENYYSLGDASQASIHFHEAKGFKEFYFPSLMGLARSEYSQANNLASITLLVEVLLNADQAEVISQAKNLLKKVSPFKSVIYIASEPAGATVAINGKEAAQKTPLLLTDLRLGTYRLELSKPGFEPQQVKKSLRTGDFESVFIKLNPAKF